MEKFTKIVRPCVVNHVSAYAEIVWDGTSLSIHGVVGPRSDGDCCGGSGQCYDEIATGKPTNSWDGEMLERFVAIWKEWHLNDMRPYCSHMKELGWIEHFGEKVKITEWDLKREAIKKSSYARERALKCLKEHEVFTPTEEETMYYNLPLSVKTYEDELPEYPDLYEFKEKDCLGHLNIEYKARRWIREDEHKLGFLGKACPVCGYKYGSKWITEEVPSDVILWLYNLPDTDKEPAWV